LRQEYLPPPLASTWTTLCIFTLLEVLHIQQEVTISASRQKIWLSSGAGNEIKRNYNQRQSLSLSVYIQQVKVEAILIDQVSCKELSHDALRKLIASLLDRWDNSFLLSIHVCYVVLLVQVNYSCLL
jgi:hypothetical protein